MRMRGRDDLYRFPPAQDAYTNGFDLALGSSREAGRYCDFRRTRCQHEKFMKRIDNFLRPCGTRGSHSRSDLHPVLRVVGDPTRTGQGHSARAGQTAAAKTLQGVFIEAASKCYIDALQRDKAD